MAVNIGIIGCGVMGSDHAAILHGSVAGGRLAAVQDVDPRAPKRSRHGSESLASWTPPRR